MDKGLFKKRQLWLFWAGDEEQLFDDMVAGNYLSVYEWGEIGSLDSDKLFNQNAIKKALKEKVEEYKTTEPGHSVKMLYDMKHNMNVGDFVVCRNKECNKIIAFGKVIGGYFYNPNHPVNNHCVEVKWNRGDWDINQILNQSHDPLSGSPRLQNVTKKDWAQKMLAVLEGITDMEPMDSQTSKDVVTMEELEILKQKKQIILQGAPGTGKTYKTASIAVGMCNPNFSDYDNHKKVMDEYDQLQKTGQIAFCSRADKKSVEEQKAKKSYMFSSDKKTLDVGFCVLKLDTSDQEYVNYTPTEFNEQNLLDDNIKPDRTDEDLFFQAMIELGIELSTKIEKRSIAGKTIYGVSDGYLMVLLRR